MNHDKIGTTTLNSQLFILNSYLSDSGYSPKHFARGGTTFAHKPCIKIWLWSNEVFSTVVKVMFHKTQKPEQNFLKANLNSQTFEKTLFITIAKQKPALVFFYRCILISLRYWNNLISQMKLYQFCFYGKPNCLRFLFTACCKILNERHNLNVQVSCYQFISPSTFSRNFQRSPITFFKKWEAITHNVFIVFESDLYFAKSSWRSYCHQFSWFSPQSFSGRFSVWTSALWRKLFSTGTSLERVCTTKAVERSTTCNFQCSFSHSSS